MAVVTIRSKIVSYPADNDYSQALGDHLRHLVSYHVNAKMRALKRICVELSTGYSVIPCLYGLQVRARDFCGGWLKLARPLLVNTPGTIHFVFDNPLKEI